MYNDFDELHVTCEVIPLLYDILKQNMMNTQQNLLFIQMQIGEVMLLHDEAQAVE